jgi:hypothetical protein
MVQMISQRGHLKHLFSLFQSIIKFRSHCTTPNSFINTRMLWSHVQSKYLPPLTSSSPPPLEVTTPTSRAVVVHDLLDVIATDQTGLTVHQHVVSIFTEEEEEEEMMMRLMRSLLLKFSRIISTSMSTVWIDEDPGLQINSSFFFLPNQSSPPSNLSTCPHGQSLESTLG